MSDETETATPAATTNDLAALAEQQFILLTTFRRSGVAVPTTIWFANAGDRLVFQAEPSAGKVKRIGNNAAITLAPSTRMGEPIGPALSARARVLDGAEAESASAALQTKYGEERTQLAQRLAHGGMTIERAYVAIEAAP